MMLDASLVDGGESVSVRVPITRPDVMHACDVMEDVAVAYSFNKLPRPLPPVCCMGSQQPVTKLTELMRIELAQMGFTEAAAPPPPPPPAPSLSRLFARRPRLLLALLLLTLLLLALLLLTLLLLP